MSHFEQHSNVFDKPIFLSKEEEKSPMLAIKEFFADYRLSEVREIHKEADYACLACDIPLFDDAEYRAELKVQKTYFARSSKWFVFQKLTSLMESGALIRVIQFPYADDLRCIEVPIAKLELEGGTCLSFDRDFIEVMAMQKDILWKSLFSDFEAPVRQRFDRTSLNKR